MRGRVLAAAAAAALLVLAACSSTAQQKPAPLAKLVSRVRVTRLWHDHIRGQAPKLRLGLSLAIDGQRVFAASHDGVVEAFDVVCSCFHLSG